MTQRAKKTDVFSGYEWVKARVTEDGSCIFTYRVKGNPIDGSDQHDEDVVDWTDQQIRELGCDLLGIDRKFAGRIEVIHD